MNHDYITLEDAAGNTASSIGFFMGDEQFPDVALESRARIDLVAHLERSYYRGKVELRLRIVRIAPPGSLSVA